jgi:Leucine-rich repeat (LRR) protein
LPEKLPKNLIYLLCSDNKLVNLPKKLPDTIHRLECTYNQLVKLPKNLPNNLSYLECFNNQISKLPEILPNELINLYCSNNKLINLPEYLPYTLTRLDCSYNQLIELPKNLPEMLSIGFGWIFCNNNYIHISKKLSQKYRIKETPNYNKKAKIIQKKWKKLKILNIMKYQESHKFFDISDLHKIIIFFL